MNLQDLFEMPQLINKELKTTGHRFKEFYSARTVASDFDMVWRQANSLNSYCVLLAKDRSFAVWGIFTHDPNREGVTGVEPTSILDFKDGYDIGIPADWDKNKVLQVDLVQTAKRSEKAGIATDMYTKLAMAGFAIVSDTEQWIGGKELWKKIAATVKPPLVVSVINKGQLVGNYDGHNIPEDQLWSGDTTHKRTLFVLHKE